jgi:hypothetical protein
MCLDICAQCGFPSTPKQITRHEAQALAAHTMKRANVSILIIDELHNALKRSDEPVDLMLKGLLQDSHGLTVIAIGTERLGAYLRDPKNKEVIGRFYEVSLNPFEKGEFRTVVQTAFDQYCGKLEMPVAEDIASDPHFASRIIAGCESTHGLCMRLIASTLVHAHENGFKSVSRSDFKYIFDLQFAHLDIHNPFEPQDFTAFEGVASAEVTRGSLLLSHLSPSAETVIAPTKKRRRQSTKMKG